jgi:hypothetical protein
VSPHYFVEVPVMPRDTPIGGAGGAEEKVNWQKRTGTVQIREFPIRMLKGRPRQLGH